MTELVIRLEHPSTRLGSQVRGTVTVYADSPIKARGLRIGLKAVARARGECVEREMSDEDYYEYTERALGRKEFTATVYRSSETIAGGSVQPGTYPFSVSVPLDAPPSFTGKVVSVSWYVEAVIDRAFRRDIKGSAPLYVYPEAPRPEPTTVAASSKSLRLEAVLPSTALTPDQPAVITVAVGAMKPTKCKEVTLTLERVENITYSDQGSSPTSTMRCHADYSETIRKEVVARDVELGPDRPLTHQVLLQAPPIPSAETEVLRVGVVLRALCKRKGFFGGTESVEVLIPTTPG